MRIGGPGPVAVPATCLADLLDPLPDIDEIADALAASFSGELGLEETRQEISSAESHAAEAIQEKYMDDEWTWRR